MSTKIITWEKKSHIVRLGISLEGKRPKIEHLSSIGEYRDGGLEAVDIDATIL